MRDDEVIELCKKLKPVIKNRADQLALAFMTSETYEEKMRIASFVQIMSIKYLSNRVDYEPILLNPPTSSEADGEFYLGEVYYGDRRTCSLFLNRDNFVRHIGIFSITGGGKSNVGMLLLLGLLKKNVPFCVVDWKRSYRALLTLDVPEVKRIKVFTLGRKASPFNWNPLRPPPNVPTKTWIAVLTEVLEKSHISGLGSGDVLMEILQKSFENVGGSMYPNFFDAKEELNKIKTGRGRRGLWQESVERILNTFTFSEVASSIFNARHPIKIEELLEDYVILELDQELSKPLRIFFSEIILRWIHLYRLSQGEIDDLRHVTLLEEVHNLFSQSGFEKNLPSGLENVFKEIRGFGEGLITITQHPYQCPIWLLGNVNTQIYLPLQHEDDIVTARRALFLNRTEEHYLDKLNIGEGIVKIKGRISPCYVKFPEIKIKKGRIRDEELNGNKEMD